MKREEKLKLFLKGGLLTYISKDTTYKEVGSFACGLIDGLIPNADNTLSNTFRMYAEALFEFINLEVDFLNQLRKHLKQDKTNKVGGAADLKELDIEEFDYIKEKSSDVDTKCN